MRSLATESTLHRVGNKTEEPDLLVHFDVDDVVMRGNAIDAHSSAGGVDEGQAVRITFS